MKLIEREIGLEVELKENVVSVVVLEEVSLRLSLLKELYVQMTGKDGNWLLAEKEKNYELSKYVELILEPFSLQLNSKKMRTKLYQDINTIADDCYYLQGLEIHSHICGYLEKLMEKVPYAVKYKEEWNVQELLKMYDVELEDECEDPCEKLFHHIRLVNQVCGTEIFITVNLKQYLTEGQLMELYKLARYSKIQLVMIEFNVGNKKLKDEEIYVLDKDACIITY